MLCYTVHFLLGKLSSAVGRVGVANIGLLRSAKSLQHSGIYRRVGRIVQINHCKPPQQGAFPLLLLF
jgi:hypothetical protein